LARRLMATIHEILSTKAVDMIAYVERLEMSRRDRSATGDHNETDGRLVVIKLSDARSKLTLEEYHPQNGATAP
jgi:hypothetical protein